MKKASSSQKDDAFFVAPILKFQLYKYVNYVIFLNNFVTIRRIEWHTFVS
jgi:hypothetical protein